jgi:hypothetical protein
MKKLGMVLGLVAVFVLALGVVALAADKYPNGCADCHKDKLAFQPLLKAYAKHPPAAANADINACLKCHKAASKLALNTKIHDSHQKAKIACDACHIMKDGKPTKDLKGVKK